MKSKDIDIVDFARFVGLYVIASGKELTHTKLQKLVYYCQAWYMVYFKKTLLFREAPEAWIGGPVYRSLYEEFKGKAKFSTSTMSPVDLCPEATTAARLQAEMKRLRARMGLTPDDVELVDGVISIYGSQSDAKLVILSHCEDPWVDARGDAEPFEYCDRKIDLEEVYAYYRKIRDNKRRLNKSARRDAATKR